MTRANSLVLRCSHTTNSERKRVLEELDRRCNAGEDTSQKSIAEWDFKEMNLTSISNLSVFSRLSANRINFEDNEFSFYPDKKRKTKGLHPYIENALLDFVDEMYARGLHFWR